jgi:hypothetical protein
MCIGGSPPKPPKPQPEEQRADAAVSGAIDAERRRQRAIAGYASTMLTGGGGLTTPATTATKTMLG